MSERHALVVDDSKVGRITMLKKLESIGFRVDMAESGLEALEYLARHHPDMIFMDHMMPDMDGFEATRRIKASPATRDIPVIIISGNDDEEFVQEARAAGALHAVSKPPAPGVLEAILETLPKEAPRLLEAAEAMHGASAVEPAPAGAGPLQVAGMVERLLGEAMASLRGKLLVDVRQQLAHLEERIRMVEAEPGPAMPDPESIRKQVEQDLSDRLAALQAGLESHIREATSTAGARHEEMARSLAGLGDSLGHLTEEVGRLAAEARAEKARHDQRLEGVEQRMQALQAAEPTPPVEEEALLAAMEVRIAPRLEALRREVQARGETPPPAGADVLLQAEMAQLKARVKTLTAALVVGGAVLAVAVVATLLR